jgi:RHS repeat-associated protein
MRFPGQRYDAASGLHYNYFRDYDPATGRYVQSDPIGLAGGVSTYGYVGGNPTVRIDSKGLEVELNLFSRYEGSPFIRVADSFVSPPGVYAVGSHGDRLHIYNQNARQLSPLELAEMIKKDEKFKGKKVVLLFGCETGRDSLSFAQQLAEILQMPVVAPSAYVFYPQKGRIYLGEKNQDNRYVQGTTGEWVTFCPGGCPWLLDTIRSWFD